MAEALRDNIKHFFSRLYELFDQVDIANRAAQVAFFFSFAIFPLLYLLLSIFGLVLESSDGLKAELFNYFRQVMPYSAFELLQKTVDEIVEKSSTGRISLGIAVTIWTVSAGLDAVRTALNSILRLTERRSWYWLKIHSLVLTVILTFLSGIALTFVFYGWQIFQFAFESIGFGNSSPIFLVVVQWSSIVIVALLAADTFYNLLPDHRQFRWVWLSPGSITATILWIVLTGGLRVYLSFFDQYNRAYGSLGAVMLLLLWLYLTSIAIMVGAAINAVIDEMSEKPPENAVKPEVAAPRN